MKSNEVILVIRSRNGHSATEAASHPGAIRGPEPPERPSRNQRRHHAPRDEFHHAECDAYVALPAKILLDSSAAQTRKPLLAPRSQKQDAPHLGGMP